MDVLLGDGYDGCAAQPCPSLASACREGGRGVLETSPGLGDADAGGIARRPDELGRTEPAELAELGIHVGLIVVAARNRQVGERVAPRVQARQDLTEALEARVVLGPDADLAH